MNKEYEAFKKNVPWFERGKEPDEIYEMEDFELTPKFISIFPKMTELINRSKKLGVEYGDRSLGLFTWEVDSEICGWMMEFSDCNLNLINEHKILIDNIGGLVGSFGSLERIKLDEIDYNYVLSLNMNYLFTGSMCHNNMDWKKYYLDLCKTEGLEPIDLSKYIVFAREADGAETMYDMENKEVILFSADNAFSFLEPIPNQPNRTLYRILGAKSFTSYVELLAKQWLKFVT